VAAACVGVSAMETSMVIGAVLISGMSVSGARIGASLEEEMVGNAPEEATGEKRVELAIESLMVSKESGLRGEVR